MSHPIDGPTLALGCQPAVYSNLKGRINPIGLCANNILLVDNLQ